MDRIADRPRWEKRVSRYKIAKLYQSDARGIRDEDLVDEIGCAFLARIESILAATEAHRGTVRCPHCDSTICRARIRGEILSCSSCAWELPWSEYHRTYRKKNLLVGGIEPFVREFASRFPGAKTYAAKLRLVDQLIHRYHWELEGNPGRPGAVNLIGGSSHEVIAFLNELTYGEQSSGELRERREKWRSNLDWGKWSHGNVERLIDAHRWESQSKFSESDNEDH